MERTTSSSPTSDRVRSFLKRLQQLAWFELFEKWFGLGVKLLWLSLFIAFCIYLRKEYKKTIYYVQDFRVPPAWVEQGYSGEVVKQAILDEIDTIMDGIYGMNRSMVGSNDDNTELLNELSVEGFNLRAVTKSILALLGKQDKTIGGYITLSDSSQHVSIQVSDQITQPLSMGRHEPAQNLIHQAALEIMKVRSPKALITYYMIKKDSVMVDKVYTYLKKHRQLMSDYYFYMTSVAVALNSLNYEEAFVWTDSAASQFPNDKLAYYTRAEIYMTLAAHSKADSATTRKYKQLFLENMRKVGEPGLSSQADNLAQTANYYLAGFYARENDVESLIDLMEHSRIETRLSAPIYNIVAYGYMARRDFKKAEAALRIALAQAGQVGDYWDSLAELRSLQGSDSLAVVYLRKALRSPQKSEAVSVQAYQADARWQRLRKRADFQQLLNQQRP